LSKFHLVLLIHAHQPVGNFDDVMERTYTRSYLPFLQALERHPGVRLGLHFSGPLLEWIAEHHGEYFQMVRTLVDRGQIEIVGGGFYEPILITIPPEDQLEQIRRLSDFATTHFGKRPAGAWLAERVWEPQLPAALAEAGVEYTLVDDSHFLAAGHEPHELFGYYIAEDRGRTVKVIPGLQALRYLLPFGSVNDSIAFLREAAGGHPAGMAAMGDDMEKFGAWPHTWEHCYRNGWVDQFFSALEANQDWLAVIPPGEALAARPPLGRADLPTASYTEMMEWVLPTVVRQRFHALWKEFESRPDVQRFLRGGFWRGFFSKYAEANLLHKKMLRVSSKLQESKCKGAKSGARGAKAVTHLLRAQCNDAYWHGIFGGLYSPHLRTELWRELIHAETIADAIQFGTKGYQEFSLLDFDADGLPEIEIISPQFAAVVKPAGGGTIAVLDFRPCAVTLINSLQRREEAYHARIKDASPTSGPVASIHEQTLAKEVGLEKLLKYDRWPRHMFRLLLFESGKTQTDYEMLRLEENAAFAGGDYRVEEAGPERVVLSLGAPLHGGSGEGWQQQNLHAVKMLRFGSAKAACDVSCGLTLAFRNAAPPGQIMVGLEIVLNLLAPTAPDRYFEVLGRRHALGWSGVVDGSHVRIVDCWQNVAVEIDARGANQIWVAPIETVSESEEGFERVYQGSQILAVWDAQIYSGKPWTCEATLHIKTAH
jgi:4-alpha-glucanotransferase